MTTGFSEIDKELAAMPRGNFGVIASRPGVGKSTLGFWLTARGWRTLFYSLECSAAELIERYQLLEIPSKKQALENGLLTIIDSPRLSVQDINAELERRQQLGTLPEIVTIDYMQLMEFPQRAEATPAPAQNMKELATQITAPLRQPTHAESVAALAQSLKGLAQKYQTNIVLLAQLNRGDESRPNLKDLRPSGSLEQTADYVLILDPNDSEWSTFTLSLIKNRHGKNAESQLEKGLHPIRFQEVYDEAAPYVPKPEVKRTAYKLRRAYEFSREGLPVLPDKWVLTDVEGDEVLCTAASLKDLLAQATDEMLDRGFYIHEPVKA